MRSIGRTVFLVAAAVLAVGLFVQVFLAGLGVFAGAGNFAIHRDTGYMLSLIPLVMIIAGLVGRVGRKLVLTSLLLGLLFIMQSMFVAVRVGNPQIAALHPVNGFVMLLLTLLVARDAWLLRERTRSADHRLPGQ